MLQKKQLPQRKISQEVYDLILESFPVEFVDDIGPYRNGYKPALKKVCDPNKHIIISQAVSLNRLTGTKLDEKNPWKQYVLVLDSDQEDEIIEDFNPAQCKWIINSELHKLGFKEEDIENRLNQFQAEKCEEFKQWHAIKAFKGEILKFNDCVYYDINKAHSDALGEIFPELKPWLAEIAVTAKTDKKWKSVPNYYVGMLAFKTKAMRANHTPGKYEKTYNWIVQRTTKMLYARRDEVSNNETRRVYANTDGMVLQHPVKIIPSSNKLGEFKIESEETTYYTYRGDNYEIIQYGDTIKGNLPICLRDRVDLRVGKVISFKRVKNKDNVFVYTDIEEININNIVEIK